MNKIYSKQLVILAIFGLILLTNVGSEISQNDSKTEVLKAAQAQELDKDWTVYTVKTGDSLARIARANFVSIYQLRAWNGLNESSILRQGMEIKIKHLEYEAYEGKASWYGPGFHGRTMANGQIFDQNQISIAHRTLPLGYTVKITNLENGKSIVTKVLDRGPYVKNTSGKYTREVDLSSAAADYLETKAKGVVNVKIEPINT